MKTKRTVTSGKWQVTSKTHHSERGIALVITLILLSVTLVMAIAFLAISRRERDSVTSTTDAATAKLAADSALAHAEAQIIANVFAATNPYNFGLLVSTNFINANGFVSGVANPANVNYAYSNGVPLNNSSDLKQNLANLLYSPRAPVFVVTNSQTGATDFRFYLDLNQNGTNDPSGLLPVISSDPANPYYNTNGFTMPNIIPGNTLSNLMVGDPEWIGQLARPDAPHGPNNFFVARYAFIAVPAGNALDLNYIHNQTGTGTVNSNPTNSIGNGYFRNQGVGSWEINLAAFLTDLNINQWDTTAAPYNYLEPNFVNNGLAFEDALSILSYRYGYTYNSLATLQAVLDGQGYSAYESGFIDTYTMGNLMTNTSLPFLNLPLSGAATPWAGADNTNHFFNLPADLLDPTKSSPEFTNHLWSAGTNISTYDRYTYYRLLSQLGTDSPAESGKINLNYVNVDANGNIVPNMETNLVPWTPVQFFTVAADRMLRTYTTNWFQTNPTNYLATYYGITNYYGNINYYYVNPDNSVLTNDPTGLGLTNIPYYGLTNTIPTFGITISAGVTNPIPVFVNGQFVYSSAVNRLLQLAANIYDASTNSFYPSVFRPLFMKDGAGNVFITGYNNVISVTGTNDLRLSTPFDATTIAALSPGVSVNVPSNDNIYGVPWIIGAKKGFPNFNEFSMQNMVQIARRMQIARTNITSNPPTILYTNELYTFSITNAIGVECWNSYTNAYSNAVQVVVNDNLLFQVMLTNGTPLLSQNYFVPNPDLTNVFIWPGVKSGLLSFILPLDTTMMVLTNSDYRFSYPFSGYSVPGFIPTGANPGWETNLTGLPALPQMLLMITNRLQVFMLDGNQVIDYVQLGGPNSSRNLNSEFQNTNSSFSGTNYYTTGVWSTALNNNNVPWGIMNQIDISDGSVGLNKTYWNDPLAPEEIAGFAVFMGLTPPSGDSTNNATAQSYATNYIVQVPYTPTITVYEYTTWQANDPLVHYMQSDLNYAGYDPNLSSPVHTGVNQEPINSTNFPVLPDLGKINVRYQPWGTNAPPETGISQSTYDESPYNLAFKDPLVWRSDNWDFPTYKFPTVGWLGRVHRGTPWQTVYLKSPNILYDIVTTNGISYVVGTNTWAIWTGDTANTFDAANSAPAQDQLLFDVFSAAPDDNATRGQLSVNVAANTNDPVAGLAAWSALFSGMVALTNTTAFPEYFPQTNLPVIVQPVGTALTNSLLRQLVVGINSTRTNKSLFSEQVFAHAGNILSTPQLTVQSPFLNINNTVLGGNQQQYGISDEMYEWLPQQAMSLLNCPTAPRYVVYCYGQTLKPAQNSLVTGGGQYFGMCTNYQIVSEAVLRAVIRVDDANTSHPRAVVESYNVLPPD